MAEPSEVACKDHAHASGTDDSDFHVGEETGLSKHSTFPSPRRYHAGISRTLPSFQMIKTVTSDM
jgi:hypothetical protein